MYKITMLIFLAITFTGCCKSLGQQTINYARSNKMATILISRNLEDIQCQETDKKCLQAKSTIQHVLKIVQKTADVIISSKK